MLLRCFLFVFFTFEISFRKKIQNKNCFDNLNINTTSVDHVTLNFVKAVFSNFKPKYCSIWVSNQALEFSKHQAEGNHKDLNQNICILLMLLNVQMKHRLLVTQI